MKKNLLVFLTAILFICNLRAQTWEEIGFNLPDGQIASSNCKITFTNKNIGWLYNEFYEGNLLNKQLYRTTDGGEDWQRVTLNNINNNPITIIFSMEPDFFYLINSDYYSENPSDVLFTKDGGNTWTQKQIVNDGYTTLHFFSEEKGIIVGEHSWVTNDGGLTWIRGGELRSPYDVYFQDELCGWAVVTGEDVNHIVKTTDGGKTWEYLDYLVSAFSTDRSAIEFIDSLKGFIIGEGLTKTIDGGENWFLDNNNIYGYDIGFLDNKNGWISSYRQIFRTTDSGETWEAQLVTEKDLSFKKIIILKKDKIAYMLGLSKINNDATLLKADLSDISGVEEKKETIPEELNLLQNFPNPFNPTTTIEYRIQKEGHVILKVYDLLGKEITTLVNERKLPGTYMIDFNGGQLSSGMYIARLTTGKLNKSIKLILIK